MYETTRCRLTGQKHFNGKVHKNKDSSNEFNALFVDLTPKLL